MNLELADKIAQAVLYEGYMLYPYRPSAVKNRQRWTFGGIYPHAYSQMQGETEPWQMRTECLVVGSPQTTLEVRVRFLHLLWREVGALTEEEKPGTGDKDADVTHYISDGGLEFRRVESLRVGDKVFHTWQEAVEREVNLPSMTLDDIVRQNQWLKLDFSFPDSLETEQLRRPDGEVVGLLVRQQQAIQGSLKVESQLEVQADNLLFKVTVSISNLTPFEKGQQKSRDEALMGSFISTHTILGVRDGEFVSLLDPPEVYRPIAANCHNAGTYPVLVGEEGERDLLLSSPIILYDYPQIAPESAGDLFDSTEIDEILILRILTLTDEEKEEARQADDRTRALLERTEALSWEQMSKLHGTVRSIRAVGKDGP